MFPSVDFEKEEIASVLKLNRVGWGGWKYIQQGQGVQPRPSLHLFQADPEESEKIDIMSLAKAKGDAISWQTSQRYNWAFLTQFSSRVRV